MTSLSLQANAKGSLSISKIFAQCVVAPALKEGWKGWHGFRWGLGSSLYSFGVPPKVIQEILRHAEAMKKLERDVARNGQGPSKSG